VRKNALIIANWQYEDALLRGLVAPFQDAESLAKVMRDPAIGGFEVQVLTNASSYRICEGIEVFLGDCERDDVALFYFSGHGVTDDDGQLYYAASNTLHKRLRSTAVAASWVNDIMNGCRSRRQILLLDCCHSGAFARTKAAASVNVSKYFTGATPEEGRGKFILTASDAFQYSFEGDEVEGKGVNSVFTEAVVEGLRTGGADLDGDGQITLDELYSFVYRRVRERTSQQTPRKWASEVEGALVIAANPNPVEAPLPEDLQAAIDSFVIEARERAIPRLDKLLRGKHRGLALTAHKLLSALANDDSRRVSSAAERCLAAYSEEVSAAQAEAGRIANEKAESAERAGHERAERERITVERAERARREQAEQERIAAEKAQRDRLAKEEAEVANRAAKEKAETVGAKEQAERERLAVEQGATGPLLKGETVAATAPTREKQTSNLEQEPASAIPSPQRENDQPQQHQGPADETERSFPKWILLVVVLCISLLIFGIGFWISLPGGPSQQAVAPHKPVSYKFSRALGGSGGIVWAVAFDPKSQVLAAGAENSLNLYSLASGNIIRTMQQKQVACLAFNREGTVLASGGVKSAVQLWNPATGESAGMLGSPPIDSAYALAFNVQEQERRIVGNELLAWGETTQPKQGQTGPQYSVHLVRTSDLKEIATLTGRETMTLTFDEFGQLYGAGETGIVRWANYSYDGKESWQEAYVGNVKAQDLAINPSESSRQMAAAGGSDGTVVIFDRYDGQSQRVLTAVNGLVGALAYSPDGRLLAVTGTGEVRLWNTSDWTLAQLLPHNPPPGSNLNAIGVVAFSPNGHWLVTATQGKPYLRLFEAEN
jgi:hypothetical protein